MSRLPSFTDQLGRTIALEHTPRKIISLVPSQTELLYALDLEDEVVGITKFCTHPPSWFRTKTRIGGTKDIHPERIEALQPDLVIANKEENDREQIEKIAAQPVSFLVTSFCASDTSSIVPRAGGATASTANTNVAPAI